MRAVPHTIPEDIYSLLLSYWLKHQFGDCWSIGHIKYLIKKEHFRYYLAWRQFYLGNAKERNEILSSLSGELQAKANTIGLSKDVIATINKDHQIISKSNFNYGRSNDQIKAKGVTLAKLLRQDGLSIDQAFSIKFAFYTTLGEPWNDYTLESKYTARLKETYPNLTIKKMDSDVYLQYAIDILLYHRKEMICGIQYIHSSNYNPDIKNPEQTKKKHDLFKSKYEVNIYQIDTHAMMSKEVPINNDIDQLIKA